MFLQWGSGLLRISEYCTIKRRLSSTNETHGQSAVLLDGRPTGQACIIYWSRRGVAVATDGEPPCPKHSGKDLLLFWLARFSFSPVVSEEDSFSATVWIAQSC